MLYLLQINQTCYICSLPSWLESDGCIGFIVVQRGSLSWMVQSVLQARIKKDCSPKSSCHNYFLIVIEYVGDPVIIDSDASLVNPWESPRPTWENLTQAPYLLHRSWFLSPLTTLEFLEIPLKPLGPPPLPTNYCFRPSQNQLWSYQMITLDSLI